MFILTIFKTIAQGTFWGLFLFVFPDSIFASNTHHPIYEEPFDIGSGGASLTRATREGAIFANPALLPWGRKPYRWTGNHLGLIIGENSRESAKKFQSLYTSDEKIDDAERQRRYRALVKKPMHAGLTNTFSIITNNVALSAFARLEPDMLAEYAGPDVNPVVTTKTEAMGGLALATGFEATKFLSFGVALKYEWVSQKIIVKDLNDPIVREELSSPENYKKELDFSKGIAADLGALLFLQGQTLDYRMALKVDDIGDTAFEGPEPSFPQIYSGGLGITLHNSLDSIHLSYDVRDFRAAYKEPLNLRTYMGAKLLIRKYLGLGYGLYQGRPSFALTLDVVLATFTLASYTRELGSVKDEDPRKIYIASMAIGF